MEMLCPKCMGTLAVSDSDQAICTLQGERYKILFSRSNDRIVKSSVGERHQNVSSDNSHSKDSSQSTMCVQHPEVHGKYICDYCEASICDVCDFPQPNGTHLCPNCVGNRSSISAISDIEEIKKKWKDEADKWVLKAATKDIEEYSPEVARIIREEALRRGLIKDDIMKKGISLQSKTEVSENGHIIRKTPIAPTGQMCSRHPEIQAVQLCKVCGAGICSTCDFSYPGDVHLCPTCATKPRFGLQGKRRTYLTWSYILAVGATLATLWFFVWSAIQSVDSSIEEEVLGQLITFFIILPSLVGTALGCAAMDRRLSTPASVWVATIWNGIILGLIVLLCIIGLFM